MPLIPLPDNFPVQWNEVQDAERFWMQDTMHAPKPMTPISQVIGGDFIAHGFSEAFKKFSIPLRTHVQHFNNYYYMSMAPLDISQEEIASSLGCTIVSLTVSTPYKISYLCKAASPYSISWVLFSALTTTPLPYLRSITSRVPSEIIIASPVPKPFLT